MKAISYYTRTTFQMSQSLLINEGRSIAGTFQYASIQIYNWAKEKFPSMGMPDKICSFNKSVSAISVDILYNWNDRLFCMKTVHPDGGVAGRTWVTEAEIVDIDGTLKFGVKNYYTDVNAYQTEWVQYSVPAFVRTLNNKIGCYDAGYANGKLIVVDSNEKFQVFRSALEDVDRKLPMVVITQNTSCDEDLIRFFEAKDGYLLDGDKLAKDLCFVAHVVYLPTAYSFQLSADVGKQWSVYDGAVRIYYAGVDFATGDYRDHPLQLASKIMASCYISDKTQKEYIGGHAYRHMLTHSLIKHLICERYDWHKLGHKFFFVANRERLKEALRRKDVAENVSTDFYLSQIQNLEDENTTLESLLATADVELDELRSQINRLKEGRVYLDCQIFDLKTRLQNQKEEIEYPNTYSAMVEWVEKYYKAQIYLHPRAIKALKNAEFENVELVYKAVQFLAEYYYNKKQGFVTEDEYQTELAKLCLKDERAITTVAAGEQGDEYFVEIGKKKYLLERHLTYGTSRDKRYCLRIYYFWDEDRNQVVIGSLPAHLNIRSSN